MYETSIAMQSLWNCVTERFCSLRTGLIFLLLPILMLTVFAFLERGPDSAVFSLSQDFRVRHLLLIYTTTLAKNTAQFYSAQNMEGFVLARLLAMVLTYSTARSLVCFVAAL